MKNCRSISSDNNRIEIIQNSQQISFLVYDEDVCHECGSKNLIENIAFKNFYCQDCGLEFWNRKIDYQAEWWKFSQRDRNQSDLGRVGRFSNIFLLGNGLSTSYFISIIIYENSLEHTFICTTYL